MGIHDWFEGTIGVTVADSTPHHRPRPHPGPDAPDIVVVLFDDLGFSQFGCYGSTMPTPNIDAIAAGGLRYTGLHCTPLCSPTRASLLAGRAHHAIGMRSVANFDTGFPNMTGHVSEHAATIPELLRDTGYATFAVGKWHLCPMEDASAAGPFDQWPCQRGFDRFYGFLQGETDQFAPELTYDNHHIDPPATAAEGYHLSEDIVDRAIGFLRDSVSVRPDRPTFTYVSFGAMHAPHQAPAEYLERHRGRYDEGWDVLRERWFARQLELGIVPEGTRLAPRNPGVEAWDDLSPEARAVAARLQEAFGAFLEHADVQVGRLVDALAELGRLDNTLLVITSDNGASQEGGPHGVLHEMKFFNGVFEPAEAMVDHLDEIGGPHSHTNYPWGWAMAGNAPCKWYKQNTHGGGVRDPFIVHWPARIATGGGIRHQFHHISDLAPTIYEIVGVTPPDTFRGVEQLPVTGTSLVYTFAGADEPTRKRAQYFEQAGHRAIWADGWKAVTRHTKGVPFDEDVWELYHLDEDFSETDDLAASHPDKLAELIDLWWDEARANGVLPLDDRTIELFGTNRVAHSPHSTRRYSYYPPVSHLPVEAAPTLGGRSWELTATVDLTGGAEGVLYATGTENSGLSLFVQAGRLVFDYNSFGDHTVVESDRTVPDGPCTLGVRFTREGRSGRAELVVDGEPAGTGDIGFVMRLISSVGADVGLDRLSPISDRYTGTFAFTGTYHRLDVEVAPTRSEREREELARAGYDAEMGRQ